MNDQHPAVAYLLAAHERAVEAARATTPVPMAGQWTVVRDKHAAEDAPLSLVQGRDPIEPDYENYSYGLPVIVLAADWQDEAEANLRHIALHDPAAVLLRVAEERNILAGHTDDRGDCAVCAWPESSDEDCDGNRSWSRSAKPWPCSAVVGLARAWGWKESSDG